MQKKRADQSHFKREFTEKVVSPPSWKIGRPPRCKKLVGGAAKISARRPTDLGVDSQTVGDTHTILHTQPFASRKMRSLHTHVRVRPVQIELRIKTGAELRYPLRTACASYFVNLCSPRWLFGWPRLHAAPSARICHAPQFALTERLCPR